MVSHCFLSIYNEIKHIIIEQSGLVYILGESKDNNIYLMKVVEHILHLYMLKVKKSNNFKS